jgi:hypothetical protein
MACAIGAIESIAFSPYHAGANFRSLAYFTGPLVLNKVFSIYRGKVLTIPITADLIESTVCITNAIG